MSLYCLKEVDLKIIFIFYLVITLSFLSCTDTVTNPRITVPDVDSSFIKLNVGQEWKYVKWIKYYDEEPFFTGDTISIKIISKVPGFVTLFEKYLNRDSITYQDTATIFLQFADSILWQDPNSSEVFGFLNNFEGFLTLKNIDSNIVTINLDTTLFFIGRQIGKDQFIGRTNHLEIFSNTFSDVTVYYSETPGFADDFGSLTFINPKQGIISSIYFGGFSLTESYGYNLIK